MNAQVLCLRPRADFLRVDAQAPAVLDVHYRKPGDADVAELMHRVAALVIPAVGPKLAPALFEDAALRLVQVTGAGLDRLDRAALQRLSIPVANVPGGSNGAVAEYAVTAASMLLRRLVSADAAIKGGNYVAARARMVADTLPALEGLLVGVIGFGTIGVAVARAFQRMGCRIAFHDPMPRDPDAVRELGATAMPLDDLLATADVVSLHVPLVPETVGLIGARELARMKPDAVLIQASRGGIVEEAALAAHLRQGLIAGAAIDVYAQEPPAGDNPLLALDADTARRLLLTPHIAGVTRQASALLFRAAWENVERVVACGEAPLHRAY
ncbi:MAG: hypothetical protein HY056_08200 [Proteobacteria bacterium]|nr:hypothetical protein [Pseudomonadota bacterium]